MHLNREDKEIMTKIGRDISFSFSWELEAEKLYQIMIQNGENKEDGGCIDESK